MHKSSRSWTILIVFLLFITSTLFIVTQNWDTINISCFESGDYASNALSIESAKQFRQTAGPYSRFKFQHPGPLYFYYLALGELILTSDLLLQGIQSHFSAHSVSQIVLNLALLWIAGWVVICSTRRLEMGFLLVFLQLLYLGSLGGGFWSSTWGPTVIVIPITLCIVSAAAVAAGNAFASFPMIIGAGIATQTHVGTIPLLSTIIGLTVFRWGYGLYKQRTPINRSSIVIVGCSFVLLFILSIPTIINLLVYGNEGGVYNLISFFLTKGGIHYSMGESLIFLAQFYKPPFAVGLSPVIWIIIGFGIMSLLRLKHSPFLYEVRLLLLLSVPLSVLSISKVIGPLHNYLVWFQYGIAGLVAFVVVGSLLLSLSRYFSPIKWLSILSCFTLVLLITRFVALIDIPRYALCSPVDGDDILRELAPERGVMYGISLGNRGGGSGPWDSALSLALALRRGGYDFCVHQRIRYMFGDRASCKVIKDSELADEARFVHLNARFEADIDKDSNVVARIGNVAIIKDPVAPKLSAGKLQ